MEVHPLRAFRNREQLSQGKLAELLNVSRPTITRWENGTRKVDGDKLPFVSEKTGIAPSELRPDLAALLKDSAS